MLSNMKKDSSICDFCSGRAFPREDGSLPPGTYCNHCYRAFEAAPRVRAYADFKRACQSLADSGDLDSVLEDMRNA